MNEMRYEISSVSQQVLAQSLSFLIHWNQTTMLERVEAGGFKDKLDTKRNNLIILLSRWPWAGITVAVFCCLLSIDQSSFRKENVKSHGKLLAHAYDRGVSHRQGE